MDRGYWGNEPIAAIERAGHVTAMEIVTLDSVFRRTPTMGQAWIGVYGGQRRYADGWDYEGEYLDQLYTLNDLLDESRAAVWSAARSAGVAGADDPRRVAFESTWTNIRFRTTLPAWQEAAAKILAAQGSTWGAALAVEAAVLAFATFVLDSDRDLIRPWEAAIEAYPEWKPMREPLALDATQPGLESP